jgi:FkbM family methyltransferase
LARHYSGGVNVRHAGSLLLRRPGTFARKSIARLSAALPFLPRRATLPLAGVRFECDFALDPRVRDMFFGVYEPEETALLERELRPGDVFVDAGANIGYFSAVAASRVGPTGEVHAFEPVPRLYDRVRAFRDANPARAIHVHPEALGDSEGTAEIRETRRRNIGWNTMVPGFMAAAETRGRHAVRVRRLDAYLRDRGVARVALLKIDVEGYELPVLRGATGHFERGDRPVIVCEVAPAAYPLLGLRVADLFDLLARFGYRATDLSSRPIVAADVRETTNVVFRAA